MNIKMKFKYMKFKTSMMLLIATLLTVNTFAQQISPKKDKHKVDGIAAVIGDQIVLESDVERDFLMSQSQGIKVDDKCEFLNDIMMEKMLIDRAKHDTLIVVSDAEVTSSLNGRLEDFVARAGSEQSVLDFFGFRTMAEMKIEMKYVVEDNIFSRRKRDAIVAGADATPEEVREFFTKHQDELPDVKEEVSLSHIVMFPEISQENEQKIIDELKQIKKDIEEGASFATKAILYSEDPGSANNGGLYTKIVRGKMVKEFDAVVYNLEEGEISEPFRSDYGYHIAKLDKRRGQELDVRHILIGLKPTEAELSKATEKLDSIRILINENKLTFREAALRYSKDKFTKFNEGNLINNQNGEDRFERVALPAKESSAILALSEGDLTKVFADDFEGKKSVRLLRLNKIYPEHKINFADDYYRIKQFTVQDKEKTILVDWVKKQIDDSFVKIGAGYQSCDFPINWEKK